jgi:hypothetical protein
VPRRQPGAKYPHVTTDAKPHNHSMCPVINAIVGRVLEGQEEWGTLHRMPPVTDEATAKQVRTGFYAARYCRELTKALGEPVSVQATYEPGDDGTFVNTVRVWPRSVAKREIARRVSSGEPLAYNVLQNLKG